MSTFCLYYSVPINMEVLIYVIIGIAESRYEYELVRIEPACHPRFQFLYGPRKQTVVKITIEPWTERVALSPIPTYAAGAP